MQECTVIIAGDMNVVLWLRDGHAKVRNIEERAQYTWEWLDEWQLKHDLKEDGRDAAEAMTGLGAHPQGSQAPHRLHLREHTVGLCGRRQGVAHQERPQTTSGRASAPRRRCDPLCATAEIRHAVPAAA